MKLGRADLFKRRPLEYHTFKYPADRWRRNQNFLRLKSKHEQLPTDNYYTLVAEDPKQRFDFNGTLGIGYTRGTLGYEQIRGTFGNEDIRGLFKHMDILCKVCLHAHMRKVEKHKVKEGVIHEATEFYKVNC